MTTSATIARVPTLQGSQNFYAWKTPCMAVLKASNVWKFIEGEPLPPVQDPEEKNYVFEERLERFQAKAELARTILVCTCASAIQQTLTELKTAQGCWSKL
jgi:hypothetical protein